MSWTIQRLESGFDVFCKDWDSLNNTIYNGHPLFDSRFIKNLVHYFYSSKLRLCIHRSPTGSVDGMVILERRRAGVWSLFLPSQAQIFPVLVKNVDDLRKIFRYLPGYAYVVELLCQDPLYSIMYGDNISLPFYREFHALTINIKVNNDFDSYWVSRSKRLKKNIRRYNQRLANDKGEVFLRISKSESDISDAVLRYGELESAGWKGEAGTAVNNSNQQGQFYLSLLADFSSTSGATVYELYAGETLIASRLCILNDFMLVILKTTYDESFSAYAPGRLLLYRILEREFVDRKIEIIEFYTNATKDQVSWATGQREIEHISIFRHGWLLGFYKGLKYFRAS